MSNFVEYLGFTFGSLVGSVVLILCVVVFVLCVFVLCLVPNISRVSGLSILDCPIDFL
jgi:hypothetical protein